jgi:uncharacterized protein YoxC
MSKLFPVAMAITALALIVVVVFQAMDLKAFGVF